MVWVSSANCSDNCFFDTATSFFFSVPLTFYNVFACSTPKHSKLSESLRPLVPLTLLFFITTGWAHFSQTNVLEVEPRTFYFIVGTLFSNVAVCFDYTKMLKLVDSFWLFHFLLVSSHCKPNVFDTMWPNQHATFAAGRHRPPLFACQSQAGWVDLAPCQCRLLHSRPSPLCHLLGAPNVRPLWHLLLQTGSPWRSRRRIIRGSTREHR